MTTKHQQITNLQQRNVKSIQPSVQDRPSHVTLTRFVRFLTDPLKPSIVGERVRPNRSTTYRIGKSLGRKFVVTRSKLILGATLLSLGLGLDGARAQEPVPPIVAFRSSVDVVRIAAVVRDHKGRFVQDLKARDFEVLDGGEARSIADVRRATAGVSLPVRVELSAR